MSDLIENWKLRVELFLYQRKQSLCRPRRTFQINVDFFLQGQTHIVSSLGSPMNVSLGNSDSGPPVNPL